MHPYHLVQKKPLPLPVLYLSRYVITRKNEYRRLLPAVTRDEAWESWLFFMPNAVEETARWTTLKIAAIRDLVEQTRSFVQAEKPKIYSRELIDVIFAQPYCRISNLDEVGVAKRQTASELTEGAGCHRRLAGA